MKELINEHKMKVDRISQEILEQAFSESQTYGDVQKKLKNFKLLAKSHFKTEHLVTVYEQALIKLEEKINATFIKKWRREMNQNYKEEK